MSWVSRNIYKELDETKLGINNIPINDIVVGEQKLLTVKKNENNEGEVGDPIQLIDKLASQTLLTQLADNANWGNVTGKSGDFIKLTGDNSDGQLGENSQELYDDNGQYFLCISHVLDVAGESTWVRNRNRDALKIGVTQDDAVIADLETETGWNTTTSIKLLTTRSKVGSWHKSDITGYLYHCYKEADTNADDTPDTWYWYRSGLPVTSDMQILNVGDYTGLVTALGTHDWDTGDFNPSTLIGEQGEQGQKYYNTTNKNLYECVFDSALSQVVWKRVFWNGKKYEIHYPELIGYPILFESNVEITKIITSSAITSISYSIDSGVTYTLIDTGVDLPLTLSSGTVYFKPDNTGNIIINIQKL